MRAIFRRVQRCPIGRNIALRAAVEANVDPRTIVRAFEYGLDALNSRIREQVSAAVQRLDLLEHLPESEEIEPYRADDSEETHVQF